MQYSSSNGEILSMQRSSSCTAEVVLGNLVCKLHGERWRNTCSTGAVCSSVVLLYHPGGAALPFRCWAVLYARFMLRDEAVQCPVQRMMQLHDPACCASLVLLLHPAPGGDMCHAVWNPRHSCCAHVGGNISIRPFPGRYSLQTLLMCPVCALLRPASGQTTHACAP
jgi:hypothetical protein